MHLIICLRKTPLELCLFSLLQFIIMINIRRCAHLGLVADRFQIGHTKIFCRVGLIADLERMRAERIKASIDGLQAWIRWYIQQQSFQDRSRQRFHCISKSNQKFFSLYTLERQLTTFKRLFASTFGFPLHPNYLLIA